MISGSDSSLFTEKRKKGKIAAQTFPLSRLFLVETHISPEITEELLPVSSPI